MGGAAVVAGDKIMGLCSGHKIPGPTGSPMPGPPMPFTAPLTSSLASTVQIGGKPAAVEGSSGYNLPPHVGLHPSDQKFVPTTQEGKVSTGSGTVLFDGKGAAYTGCTVSGCVTSSPKVMGTGTSVIVGS
ncbi:PAAR domain-containing protein [Cellulomonas sp. URHD0024]|uniref:PAAR domain-containing protein n=1 Tax=Cellulomonas sp. URHD0024 TaxID=1302620 RepID=UPI0004171E8F|nr:PAAR domain-containing protein [Cellulomonas sp. URHD0024]